MSRQLGRPYPYDVWLDVSLDGVPVENRRGIMTQLAQIEGWKSGLTGRDGGALRYGYRRGRERTILQHVRQIVRQAGGSEANVSSFVLWRVDFDFRSVLGVDVFAPMTERVRNLPGVLNTHARGQDLSLSGLTVEFRGQPSSSTLQRIKALVAPHVAA